MRMERELYGVRQLSVSVCKYSFTVFRVRRHTNAVRQSLRSLVRVLVHTVSINAFADTERLRVFVFKSNELDFKWQMDKRKKETNIGEVSVALNVFVGDKSLVFFAKFPKWFFEIDVCERKRVEDLCWESGNAQNYKARFITH